MHTGQGARRILLPLYQSNAMEFMGKWVPAYRLSDKWVHNIIWQISSTHDQDENPDQHGNGGRFGLI